jgi:hypothetical protein
VERFGEVGLQVAAHHRGERVVHAWLGDADHGSGRRVEEDTLFLMFSCSKGVTATLIHCLAERGTIDCQAPVAKYWSGFARSGKNAITVRHVLSHRAGLPDVPGISWVDQRSVRAAARARKDVSPAWPVGSTLRYHPVTCRLVRGNVACRVARAPFRQRVTHGIEAKSRTSDLDVGLPAHDPPLSMRRASIVMARLSGADPVAGLYSDNAWEGARRMVDLGEDPQGVHGVMPGANPTFTAEPLARHCAAMRPECLGAGSLLEPVTIREATILQRGADGLPLPQGLRLGCILGGTPPGSRPVGGLSHRKMRLVTMTLAGARGCTYRNHASPSLWPKLRTRRRDLPTCHGRLSSVPSPNAWVASVRHPGRQRFGSCSGGRTVARADAKAMAAATARGRDSAPIGTVETEPGTVDSASRIDVSRSEGETVEGICNVRDARRANASTRADASLPGVAPRRNTSCGAPPRVRPRAAVRSPNTVGTVATEAASARGLAPTRLRWGKSLKPSRI